MSTDHQKYSTENQTAAIGAYAEQRNLTVVRTYADHGRSGRRIDGRDVRPAGDILLRLSGWPKVERVLQIADAVEALGIDPADAAPDYWHHVHNRLSVNETPRAYTRPRHQAWLHRRRIAP